MKTGSFILASAAIMLAACQTIPLSSQSEQPTDVYSALGTEPFWSLKIGVDTMRFERAGLPGATGSPFKAQPSFNGWRYLATTMTVDVTFAPCSDGMSDKTYKDTVTVMFGDIQYKGCGGVVLPPVSLDQTDWQISGIGGIAPAKGVKTELRFADGKISGTAGCNGFSGTYSVDGNSLTIGPVATTKMMCPEPQMAQESKFYCYSAAAR